MQGGRQTTVSLGMKVARAGRRLPSKRSTEWRVVALDSTLQLTPCGDGHGRSDAQSGGSRQPVRLAWWNSLEKNVKKNADSKNSVQKKNIHLSLFFFKVSSSSFFLFPFFFFHFNHFSVISQGVFLFQVQTSESKPLHGPAKPANVFGRLGHHSTLKVWCNLSRAPVQADDTERSAHQPSAFSLHQKINHR